MKKYFLLFGALCVGTVAFGQMKVQSDGRVTENPSSNAMLCVYDMNGRQLSQNIMTQRGSSVFVVNGNQYGAGMYLYSLIADNQIVDTKKMILTK